MKRPEEILAEWFPKLADSGRSVFKTHGTLINTIALFVIGGSVVFLLYQSFWRPSIRVLAGPTGSAGSKYADLIIDANNRTQFSSVDLQKELTGGFEENREIIASESGSSAIGFAHDGFGESSNVRILVPLDHSYLHILCSRTLFHELEESCGCTSQVAESEAGQAKQEQALAAVEPGEQTGRSDVKTASNHSAGNANAPPDPSRPCKATRVPTLYDVLFLAKNYLVKNGVDQNPSTRLGNPRRLRIALGPEKSGTREVALSVLDHFRLRGESYHEVTISSWSSLRDQLRDNEIDVAFYIGPNNSPLIRQIAVDDSCFLLDLGNDASAIAHDFTKPVSVHEFLTHQYGRTIDEEAPLDDFPRRSRLDVKTVVEGEWSQVVLREPDFCEHVRLLATRRVLLCSKDLPNSTAYGVALLTRQALSERVGEFGFSAVRPLEQETGFRFLLHPAAALIRENEQPGSTWFRNAMAYVAVVVGAAIWITLANMLKEQPPEEPDDGSGPEAGPAGADGGDPFAPAEVEDDYEKLSKIMERALDDLSYFTPRELTSTMFRDWQRKLGQLEWSVRDSHANGRLSKAHCEELEEFIREKLKKFLERDFSRNTRRTAGAR